MFAGLLAIYVVAFFAVGAEWFWGRWFATGVGYWGITMAVMAFVTTRSMPTPILIFGVMHALVAVCLMGEKMAAVFDAKPAWRERWKLDDQGVIRVRKSVTRAASSLPALIMFALAPRESAALLGVSGWDFTMLVLVLVAVVAVVGLLTSLRTWTLLTLAALGIAVASRALGETSLVWNGATGIDWTMALPPGTLHFAGLLAGVVMAAASLPFLGPMVSFVLRRR
jgi:hypothetical protein